MGILFFCFIVGLIVVLLFSEGGRAFLKLIFAILGSIAGIILIGAAVIGILVFLIVAIVD